MFWGSSSNGNKGRTKRFQVTGINHKEQITALYNFVHPVHVSLEQLMSQIVG